MKFKIFIVLTALLISVSAEAKTTQCSFFTFKDTELQNLNSDEILILDTDLEIHRDCCRKKNPARFDQLASQVSLILQSMIVSEDLEKLSPEFVETELLKRIDTADTLMTQIESDSRLTEIQKIGLIKRYFELKIHTQSVLNSYRFPNPFPHPLIFVGLSLGMGLLGILTWYYVNSVSSVILKVENTELTQATSTSADVISDFYFEKMIDEMKDLSI